jgi:uncharacterized protein
MSMSSSDHVTGVAPLPRAERIEVLDVLRGFALSGILFVNIGTFSGRDFLSAARAEALPGGRLDGLVTFLVSWLIHAKFYSLFSLLFGIGFAVFMQRAAAKGASPAPLFRRRLTGLLIIGLAHSMLLWFGDILHLYALLGFLLLPFHRAAPRTILRWSLAFLALPLLLHGLAVLAAVAAGRTAPAAGGPPPAALAGAIQSLRAGSYGAIVRANVVLTANGFAFHRLLQMQAIRVYGMFLLGLYLTRSGLLERRPDRTTLWRVVGWGLLIGLPTGVAAARLPAPRLLPQVTMTAWLQTTTESIAAFALSLAYASAIVLMFEHPRGRRILSPLADYGRTALTNYIAQTAICMVIFYGIGFGLFMRLASPYLMIIATSIVAIQVGISRLWMKRFKHGPAEFAWRWFTYGTLPKSMGVDAP